MTIKQLRARLDRLERSIKLDDPKVEQKKLPFEFPIDPALAKEILDEQRFLHAVRSSRGFRSISRGDPETPEESLAGARIVELARTISCPTHYGFKQFWSDHKRVNELFVEKEAISDAEEAQVTARMEAFKQSPEGRARIRLDELENGPGLITPAALEEMERLLKLYPEPWADPRYTNHVRWLIDKRGTPKDRKRRAEKHQRWIKEREAARRSEIKPKKKKLYTQWDVSRYIEVLRKNGCPAL
jgi:hypothetical protein